MPTWVGDAVMATPTLRALRRRFAQAYIALLARPHLRDVMTPGPWFDDFVGWAPTRRGVGGLLDSAKIAVRLRRERFDWAVLLSNAFRVALIARLAGIPRRIGYDRDGRGWLLTDRMKPRRAGRTFAMVSMVHYYNELAAGLGCDPAGEDFELFTTAEDEATVQQRLAAWGLAEHHPLVVINPGASFGSSKLWLAERYAEVADRLWDMHNARVVVTCGPGEEALAWQIHEAMRHKPFVVDRPRASLGQLKAIIRRCDLLLNNDTGPRHFAKAFRRPVVTVFGSTYPEWTDTDYPLERKVRIDVDCGPCHEKVCPYSHHKCMTGVTVEMVHQAAVELLTGCSANIPLAVLS